jgi:hypothetical protein
MLSGAEVTWTCSAETLLPTTDVDTSRVNAKDWIPSFKTSVSQCVSLITARSRLLRTLKNIQYLHAFLYIRL